jgi:hypothetical protein
VRSVSGGRIGTRRQPSEILASTQIDLIEEGVAQFGAVGGIAIQTGELAIDAVNATGDAITGPIFDQTFGRAFFGSPAASRERRQSSYDALLERRATGYFAPARDLANQYNEGSTDTNLLAGELGAYGRGIPGVMNLATDYVENIASAGV